MSKNLVYTSLTERQIVPIFTCFSAEVARWMMPRAPYTLAQARDLVLDTVEAMALGGHIALAILSRGSVEFLGSVALNGVGQHAPEIGIWLKAEAQGHGWGRETLGALMAWYQKRYRPDYYVYPADVRNLPSCYLARKMGGSVARRYETVSQDGILLRVAEFRIPPVVVR